MFVQNQCMKLFVVILLFFTAKSAAAHNGSFVDPRDNKKYETIVIGKSIWFREHLRYETTLSYFPNFNNGRGNAAKGNYYSNAELDNVCPAGWHVATLPDWEEYVAVVL